MVSCLVMSVLSLISNCTVLFSLVIPVSSETIQKNINTMGKQLKDLELDMKALGKSNDPEDKFAEVMKISFGDSTQSIVLIFCMCNSLILNS